MTHGPTSDFLRGEALHVTPVVTDTPAGGQSMHHRVTEPGGRTIVGRSSELWFSTGGYPIANTADAIVPALLPAAMVRGVDLRIDAPVSADMLRAAERVQDVLGLWMPHWHRVAVTAPVRSVPRLTAVDARTTSDRAHGGAVGAFFSAGVDSFHTLLQNRDTITHLIFVHGFDIPVSRDDLHAPARDAVRQVAVALGLELVEVRTNMRALTDPWVSWDMQHGAGLAAVAHLLAPSFKRILIPSSYSNAFLSPHGSHPGLDPLWSADGLQIVHDGCEVSRFEKVVAIAGWDLVRKHLRVCWQNTPGAYNCGACRKCQWTMLYLRACGELASNERFSRPLDPTAMAGFPLDHDDQRYRLMQVLSALRRSADRDPALERTVEDMLARGRAAAKPSLARDLRRDVRRTVRAGLDALRIGRRRRDP